MIEYQGKHGKAKVMIDEIDQATVSQIYEFLNHEVFTNPIAIMPDTHAGAGAVIGFTMEMTDKVIPNVVGVDIGCGMFSMEFESSPFMKYSKKELDEKIRETIPFGTSVRKSPYLEYLTDEHFDVITINSSFFTKVFNAKYGTEYAPVKYDIEWFKKKCGQIGIDYHRALTSIGTLGGGNHFIEFSKSEKTGKTWVTIHSGSRQFGLKVANYWQKKAGRGQLAYLEGENMFGYLQDMYFAQEYANINRLTMAKDIFDIVGTEAGYIIETVHNFIDFGDFIIRKGAIRSYEGEPMIIPFNMEDGILICEGKSNPEWNFSAPHGAGRMFARRKAKEKFKRIEEDIKHRMEKKDIYFSKLPLDEVKESYKDPKIIEESIEPTATIVDRLKPIISMKE